MYCYYDSVTSDDWLTFIKHCVPSTILSLLHVSFSPHSNPTTYYYCASFTDEKMETQRLEAFLWFES